MQLQNPIKNNLTSEDLPPIPDKLYFSIGEVSKLCCLKAYVLRFWEQEFSQLAPIKRRNRRYYQRKDILLIREIKTLLYEQGFTIEGARNKLAAEVLSVKKHFDSAFLRETLTKLENLLQNLEAECRVD